MKNLKEYIVNEASRNFKIKDDYDGDNLKFKPENDYDYVNIGMYKYFHMKFLELSSSKNKCKEYFEEIEDTSKYDSKGPEYIEDALDKIVELGLCDKKYVDPDEASRWVYLISGRIAKKILYYNRYPKFEEAYYGTKMDE